MAPIIFEKLTVEEEKKTKAGEIYPSPQAEVCTEGYPRITCIPLPC